MLRILVVFTSTFGNPTHLAKTLKTGAGSVASRSVELKAAEQTWLDLVHSSDAVLVGSLNHHRSLDARIKLWVQKPLKVRWLRDEMVGKVGAVFTCVARLHWHDLHHDAASSVDL